jgi:hypothetical protein
LSSKFYSEKAVSDTLGTTNSERTHTMGQNRLSDALAEALAPRHPEEPPPLSEATEALTESDSGLSRPEQQFFRRIPGMISPKLVYAAESHTLKPHVVKDSDHELSNGMYLFRVTVTPPRPTGRDAMGRVGHKVFYVVGGQFSADRGDFYLESGARDAKGKKTERFYSDGLSFEEFRALIKTGKPWAWLKPKRTQ